MAQAVIAFEPLAQWLRGRSRELLPQWFPKGRIVGREFKVGNLQGEPGESLSTNLDSCLWADFETGQKGRDLISLWAAMHGLRQLEAAKDLANKYGYGSLETNVVPLRPAVSEAAPPPDFQWPPADAPRDVGHFKHVRHGIPKYVFQYLTQDRRLIYMVARHELATGAKAFCPWTWRDGRWTPKAHPAPRPLYGLHRLESFPGPTIIVEGEKKADALQAQTQKSSVISWSGGANNWSHTDWTPLRERHCILWPDADAPGFAAMQGIAGQLLFLGCPIHLIDTEGLTEGFDAFDVIQQHQGDALVKWIKVRLRPLKSAAPAPQVIQRPKSIPPAVTVTPDGKVEGDKQAAPGPSYAVAGQYGLTFNRSGVHANMANARALIAGLVKERKLDPLFYDTFLQKVMTGRSSDALREWTDWDYLALLDGMQRDFGINAMRKSAVEHAVALYAYQHKRNVAREWIEEQKWDGRGRIDYLFSSGFGTVHSDYTSAVSRCFMIGMVARVLDPGCQVDYLPVIEGEQGSGKSQALRALAGPWHAECQESVMGKDFYLVLTGKVLVEIAELSSFRRADIERVKQVITCVDDRFRAPYERAASDHPRSCVFVASTNADDWNRDDTGARRFWPLASGRIHVDWIKEQRGQLFAEAATRFEAGESWWDVPAEAARREQERRRSEDMVLSQVRHYMQARREATMVEIVTYGLSIEGHYRFDRGIQARVSSALRILGYRPLTTTASGPEVERVWRLKSLTPQLPLPEGDEPF